jgi:hypothetical protein
MKEGAKKMREFNMVKSKAYWYLINEIADALAYPPEHIRKAELRALIEHIGLADDVKWKMRLNAAKDKWRNAQGDSQNAEDAQ